LSSLANRAWPRRRSEWFGFYEPKLCPLGQMLGLRSRIQFLIFLYLNRHKEPVAGWHTCAIAYEKNKTRASDDDELTLSELNYLMVRSARVLVRDFQDMEKLSYALLNEPRPKCYLPVMSISTQLLGQDCWYAIRKSGGIILARTERGLFHTGAFAVRLVHNFNSRSWSQ
jgi:hypothetical protein